MTRDGWSLSDLDRCEHGRHATDNCFGCPGGWSTGNLLAPAGTVIGHSLTGRAITVPAGDLGDGARWLAPPPAPAQCGALVATVGGRDMFCTMAPGHPDPARHSYTATRPAVDNPAGTETT